MRVGLLISGAVLLLVGLVWTGQGANLIGGSFMTGQPIWVVIGIATTIGGAALLWWAATGHRRVP